MIFIAGNIIAQTTPSAPSETLYPVATSTNSYSNVNPLGYVEYLPEGYNVSNNWPVIIYLHGISESYKSSLNSYSNLVNVAKKGPNSYASPFRNNHKLPAIILSPQCQNGWWYPEDIEAFRKFAMLKYKVDRSRLYMTGHSMGGGGTCDYINTYGINLAAAIPIAAAGTIDDDGAQTVVQNKIPVWSTLAQNDTVVGTDQTRWSYEAISTVLGGTNVVDLPTLTNIVVNGKTLYTAKTAYFDTTQKRFVWNIDGQNTRPNVPPFFFTLYSSGGHNITDRMYQKASTYEWLLQQKSSVPQYHVSGKITCFETGLPMAGATVSMGDFVAITSSTGEYTLPDSFAGSYGLIASKPGYASELHNVNLNSNQIINIQLGLPHRLTGTVTDANTGSPLQNTLVSSGLVSTSTALDGSYILENVPHGNQLIHVEAKHYIPLNRTVNFTQDEIQIFSLKPRYTFQGKVTNTSTGNPVKYPDVILTNISSTPEWSETEFYDYGDETGEFSVVDILPGTYSVKIWANGYETQTFSNITISGNSTQDYKMDSPVLSVSPSSINQTLTQQGSSNNSIILKNTGNKDLNWKIFSEYGFSSSDTGGVSYSWIEISTTGTKISGLGDDTMADPIGIGFSFPFFGEFFQSLRVYSNGFLTFSNDVQFDRYGVPSLPDSHAISDLIAFGWNDLDFNQGGAAYYQLIDENTLVIEFKSVANYFSSSNKFTAEIILKSDGSILMQYQRVDSPWNYQVGIQNETKDKGLSFQDDSYFLHPNLALVFSPSRYVNFSSVSGAVSPGAQSTTSAQIFSGTLLPGIYSTSYVIESNDPIAQKKMIPITLTVTASNTPPNIALSSNLSTTTAPGSITLTANATDTDGTITKVEFFNGTQKIFEDTTAPYSFIWKFIPVGTFSVTAKATDNLGATKVSTPVKIQVTPLSGGSLPQGWTSGTIGQTINSSFGYSNSIYTVTGTGLISGNVDSAPFDAVSWTGDCQIIARVTSLQNLSSSVKAGIMIREDATSSSRFASTVLYPGDAKFISRNKTYGELNRGNTVSAKIPWWIKLVRYGNSISGFKSPDGVNWTLLGTDIINMPTNVSVGLTVISDDPSKPATATFDHVSIIAPTINSDMPIVSLTSQQIGTQLQAPAIVSLTANASDVDGIAQVEFFDGETLVGKTTAAPYQITLNQVSGGTKTYTARATDKKGATVASTPITINITPEIGREFLTDFGLSSLTTTKSKGLTWNNVTSISAGTTINLVDTAGLSSSLLLSIVDSFGSDSTGTITANGAKTSAIYPLSATHDAFFLGTYNSVTDDFAVVRVSGLQSNATYKIRLYGSRMTTSVNDRTTVFTINGVSKELQARNNVDGYVEFTHCVPTNGSLDVNVSRKSGSYGGYFGVLDIIKE